MATLAVVEPSTLSDLSALSTPEVATLAAQFLAVAPLLVAVVLLVAALAAGGRGVPAAEIVPRRSARTHKVGG